MPALPGFSLYSRGIGSVELLSGRGIDWSDDMISYHQCLECPVRDSCDGHACQAMDALDAAEARRDG